jgi:hypothetical protein
MAPGAKPKKKRKAGFTPSKQRRQLALRPSGGVKKKKRRAPGKRLSQFVGRCVEWVLGWWDRK